MSETIKRILEQLEVTVRFRPDTTLRKLLVHTKDSVSLNYRISCKDCDHRSIWTLVELQSEGASKSSLKWRHSRVSFGRACVEGGAQYQLRECGNTRSEPAILEANVLVGVMAQQQRAEPLNRERGPLPEIPAHKLDLTYCVCMRSLSYPILTPPSFMHYLIPVFVTSVYSLMMTLKYQY